MFNLIVSGNESAWETAQPWSMMAGRFKEYSGTSIEVDAISMSDIQSLKKLEDVPTLIMYEWGIGAANGGIVRFGYLQNIKRTGQTISFNFREEAHADRDIIVEYASELQINDLEKSRTHWAIKDGDIPRELLEQMVPGNFQKFRYDVVFSYADEENEYVKKVVAFLQKEDIKLFYAPFKEAVLWGRDLAEELEIIYRKDGRYCVMFISENYAKKAWPNHEKKSAMSREVQQKDRYILPCRFDDTEVPGLPTSISYIDLNHKTPEELGELIRQVLRRRRI